MARELTKEEILALSDPNPEFEAYVQENGPPRRPATDLAVARANMDKNQKQRIMQMPIPEGIVEEEITVPARDGHEIPCRVHKPRDNSSLGPLAVVFHAGGFVAGGPFQEFANCRNYVRTHGVVCVNVDYRLAPESQFPTPVYDAFDAVRWAAENASRLGADPGKGFILAGTSAGANLANVCAHLARDINMSPPLTGIHLAAPLVIASNMPPERYRQEYLSWEQNKDAPFLDRETCRQFSRHYNPDRTSPLYNCINSDHSSLPRLYIQACGGDIFRDDALIYEKMLRTEYGLETKLDIYAGMPHGFWVLFRDFAITKRAIQDRNKGVGWLLRRHEEENGIC